MSPSSSAEVVAKPKGELAGAGISRWVRRIHMFTGLFLAPWMVMYALSTMVMTRQDFGGPRRPVMVTERESDYSRAFPTNQSREEIAQQILEDLGMSGAHSVSGGRNGASLVIQRQHALPQRRITFDASRSKVSIEREGFRSSTFLERMHRRRGYTHPYALEDTWGFSVDVAVVTMVFWSLSGVWLAWELKTTRIWGALSFVLGMGLFVLFAMLI